MLAVGKPADWSRYFDPGGMTFRVMGNLCKMIPASGADVPIRQSVRLFIQVGWFAAQAMRERIGLLARRRK
jgi:hypothetical protein